MKKFEVVIANEPVPYDVEADFYEITATRAVNFYMGTPTSLVALVATFSLYTLMSIELIDTEQQP